MTMEVWLPLHSNVVVMVMMHRENFLKQSIPRQQQSRETRDENVSLLEEVAERRPAVFADVEIVVLVVVVAWTKLRHCYYYYLTF